MAKVFVTGATGLLGCSLVPFLENCGYRVIGVGNNHSTDLSVDLTCPEQTIQTLDTVKPDIIINLVGLTNVDLCEACPQEAYLLNVKTVGSLCSWIKTADQACHLIHISTDHLYDGLGPHSEDQLTIRNSYAMSKLAGELFAGTVRSTILRTNFVGRSLCEHRTSFSDWLHAALIDNKQIDVFSDVMFSPLAISTLCNCVERCIVDNVHGVFNLGSRDGMSKADFAFAFAAVLGLDATNLKRVNSHTINTLVARRPTDMRLNCDRFEARMRIRLPLLIDEVYRIAAEYF